MDPLIKSEVPVAAPRSHKFNLTSNHLTTANFMQFNVGYCRQLIPGSHGKLDHKTFIRTQPLDKPCLGSAQIHNTAIFVPFRTVWEPFSDFIVNTPHNQPSGTALISYVPTISYSELKSFALDSLISSAGSVQNYDFKLGTNYYIFTPFGRQCFKILNQLGYRFNGELKNETVSALPLLCLAKAYLDFYFPQAYAHYGVFAIIDGIFQRHVTYSLTALELQSIFNAIAQVGYKDDFYSAIWDNPTGPNSGVGSIDFSIPDITQSTFGTVNQSNVTQDPNNGTPIYADSSVSWSQYIDSTVKALTKYVKRHQLSSYTIDRYLMEFGISLDWSKLRRSIYLGDDSFPLQIGDVMSMADTASDGGASLGAYAGKGVAYSDSHIFDFNTDEFGYLFVINTIVPDVSYVQGIDRNVMCISKLDFLTHEFDGLGPAIVRQEELLVDDTNVSSNYNTYAHSKGFGFAGQYYWFKIPYNRMTGDFVVNSLNRDLNSWSTARMFDASIYNANPDLFKHNLDFVFGLDALQYDRIFLGYSSEDNSDPFFVIHRDDMTLYANMLPLYEDCVFDDDEDTERKVSVRVGGVKVN